MSALTNIFQSARSKVTAGVLAAMMLASFGNAATAQDLASANQGQQAAVSTETVRGKPVTLRVGPGFSLSEANYIAAFLEKEGCEAKVFEDGFIPNSIDVEINGGKPHNFESLGSAGAYALRECKVEI